MLCINQSEMSNVMYQPIRIDFPLPIWHLMSGMLVDSMNQPTMMSTTSVKMVLKAGAQLLEAATRTLSRCSMISSEWVASSLALTVSSNFSIPSCINQSEISTTLCQPIRREYSPCYHLHEWCTLPAQSSTVSVSSPCLLPHTDQSEESVMWFQPIRREYSYLFPNPGDPVTKVLMQWSHTTQRLGTEQLHPPGVVTTLHHLHHSILTNHNTVLSCVNQSESSISHLYQVTAPGHIGAVLSEEETLIDVENQSQRHWLVPLLHQLPLQRGQSRVLQHIVHCFSVQLQSSLTQLTLLELELEFVTIQVQVQNPIPKTNKTNSKRLGLGVTLFCHATTHSGLRQSRVELCSLLTII